MPIQKENDMNLAPVIEVEEEVGKLIQDEIDRITKLWRVEGPPRFIPFPRQGKSTMYAPVKKLDASHVDMLRETCGYHQYRALLAIQRLEDKRSKRTATTAADHMVWAKWMHWKAHELEFPGEAYDGSTVFPTVRLLSQACDQ